MLGAPVTIWACCSPRGHAPLAGRGPRPYAPLMPDRVFLRYFDCLGRAQPLRSALVDAGIAFEDQRLAIDPSWRALKEQADGGPFGSLPRCSRGDEHRARLDPAARV